MPPRYSCTDYRQLLEGELCLDTYFLDAGFRWDEYYF